jgi:hypothetical protein
MFNRKWLPTLTLAIFLLIPGVALAQRNTGERIIVIQRNDRVGVVIVLPRNANEFENVYERRPSRSEVIDMLKTRRMVERLDNPVLRVQPDARTPTGLETYIRQSDEKVIALVGHNDDGEFRFADGSTRNLATIDALAKKHDKLLAHLSCDAIDHVHHAPAATGTLTNRDALNMANAIGKGIGQGPPSTNNPLRFEDLPGRIQANIDAVERLSAIKAELKATAVVGTLGSGLVVEQWRRNKRR